MPSHLGAVYICLEGTPGTEESVDASEAVGLDSFSYQVQGAAHSRFAQIRPWQAGISPAKPPSHYVDMTIEGEVKASADGSAAPELANILKSIGFEAVSAVQYNWYDAPNAAATDASVTVRAEMVADGNELVAYGSRFGGLVLRYTPETGLRFSASGKGAYEELAASTGTTPTYNTGVPLMEMDDTAPFLIANYEGVLRSWELSIPSEVALRASGGALAADGHYAWPPYVYRSGDPTIKAVIEMPLQSVHDWMANWLANTDYSADTAKFVAGSRSLTIDLASVRMDRPEIDLSGRPALVTLTGIVGRTIAAGYDIDFLWA